MKSGPKEDRRIKEDRVFLLSIQENNEYREIQTNNLRIIDLSANKSLAVGDDYFCCVIIMTFCQHTFTPAILSH